MGNASDVEGEEEGRGASQVPDDDAAVDEGDGPRGAKRKSTDDPGGAPGIASKHPRSPLSVSPLASNWTRSASTAARSQSAAATLAPGALPGGSSAAAMRFADAADADAFNADADHEGKAVASASPLTTTTSTGNGAPAPAVTVEGNGLGSAKLKAAAVAAPAVEEEQWLGPGGLIPRGEYVRLIEQVLHPKPLNPEP